MFRTVRISKEAIADINRDLHDIDVCIEAQKDEIGDNRDNCDLAIFMLGMMYQQIRNGGNRKELK